MVSSLDLVDKRKLIWSFLTSLCGKKPFLLVHFKVCAVHKNQVVCNKLKKS